ncbi:hypothetical protein COV17_02955 [Candidatus Woesearchaeota archaeon CG10_big_fil_rev_8_21_14_0_10_36_11]|nr:MAG: hypothetical protein COV17_02955 [Candidatus Woesearchaeota archaeon CG10_big_fil_rev_8_21_14_0_10_36_11]
MKITLCGSLQFINEMKNVESQLTQLGHHVLVPESAIEGRNKEYWNNIKKDNIQEFSNVMGKRILLHFGKIDSSDAVLILNFDKNGKRNYIGPNTFLEMGHAFGMKKKIFTLNPLPEDSHNDELVSMSSININNNLHNIH